MAKSFVIHACLILLTFCQGKGSRRKKIIENYKRDSSIQRRLFDGNDYNIFKDEEDYNEYPDYYDTEYDPWDPPYKNIKLHTWDDYNEQKTSHEESVKKLPNKMKNIIKLDNKSQSNANFVMNLSPNDKWPKFEDILLAMGKRYDWKNDRWIKVKKKLKGDDGTNHKNVNTSINFHEKHRFIYRIVRLNRPKSKRNIILAVTAIR